MLLELFVLAQIATGPVAPAPDVLGWQATRWGMSRAELVRLFPEATAPRSAPGRADVALGPSPTPTPGKGALELARVDISGGTYRATASFDDARGLYAVSLVPIEEPLGYSGALARFRSLEAALTEKYGQPSVSQGSPFPTRIWTFPSSRIKLWFLGVAEVDHGGLVLTYSRRDPSASKNL
ncbi:MAG: hypothetical protein ACYC4P_07265 [Thermoanaerobaculia bacterium]